jgi:hypothetical protein
MKMVILSILTFFILYLLYKLKYLKTVKLDYYQGNNVGNSVNSDKSDNSKIFQGSKILSDAGKVDCSHYSSFIEKPYNKAYYQAPRFVNPNKACEDECIYGVWNDNNKKPDSEETTGSEECCKKACKIIPEK